MTDVQKDVRATLPGPTPDLSEHGDQVANLPVSALAALPWPAKVEWSAMNAQEQRANNGVRARQGLRALDTYTQVASGPDARRLEPAGDQLAFLVADLRHLADALELDWEQLLQAAEEHYVDEVN